jgi:hypothetical protein
LRGNNSLPEFAFGEPHLELLQQCPQIRSLPFTGFISGLFAAFPEQQIFPFLALIQEFAFGRRTLDISGQRWIGFFSTPGSETKRAFLDQ